MSRYESEPAQGGETFRARHGIDLAAQTIGVLFGSRGGEFKRVAPFIRDAVFSLGQKQAGDSGIQRHLVVPTLPWLKERAEALVAGSPFPVTIVTDPGQKWQAFRAMDVACAVSGTVGLELAVAGVPHIIAYKTGALTWRILKGRVKTKYAHLANILLDRPLVPEFIQERCATGLIGEALGELAASAPRQAGQREGFAAVRALLRGNDAEKPPELQAASFILSQFAAKCL